MKKLSFRTMLAGSVAALLLFGASGLATVHAAIALTAENSCASGTQGPPVSQNAIIDAFFSSACAPAGNLLFKNDTTGVGNTGTNTPGPFAGSYVLTQTLGGGELTYNAGTPVISSTPVWLLAKDGASQSPNWYGWNLTVLGWTGTQQLNLALGWGDALSNVTIWGPGVGIPEPATFLLFGAGLLGLAAIRRRLV